MTFTTYSDGSCATGTGVAVLSSSTCTSGTTSPSLDDNAYYMATCDTSGHAVINSYSDSACSLLTFSSAAPEHIESLWGVVPRKQHGANAPGPSIQSRRGDLLDLAVLEHLNNLKHRLMASAPDGVAEVERHVVLSEGLGESPEIRPLSSARGRSSSPKNRRPGSRARGRRTG